MKKFSLFIALAAIVCLTSSFTTRSVSHNAVRQSKVQPFCKFTFIDHRGHSTKLSTNIMHASQTSMTFIFETGEKLIMKFTSIRPGHFVAESARSKDPQIIYYPSHSSNFHGMVGAVMITSTRPMITGNFSHLVSDDNDEHLTLVSGSFSF